MREGIETPGFKTEEEEAAWWDNNQALLLSEFKKAEKNRTLQRHTPSSSRTPTTTIRLDPKDIALAKVQAEARGLRYQTYLKMIIHQALLQQADSPKQTT